ncbi:MAG: helix-turn-helix domain-containing protein [Lachnospiraceae bacterium]|jgi:Predicted transcriptional regulators
MESRIKQLREKRGLIQEILAAELGITQQLLSRYERDITVIKIDILKKIAVYFNVTTDYLLGLSDVKRDLQGQIRMSKILDEYFDFVEVYKELDLFDQEMMWRIIQSVKKASEQRKKEQKRVGKNAEHSNLR